VRTNAETQGPVVPDEQIDTSDIPEVTDWTGGVRGLFARPETRMVSIRLSAADLVIAHRLAAQEAMPYQTYIKMILHEALTRNAAAL
jgi:predicted DNA binding CopG/RHH family protein